MASDLQHNVRALMVRARSPMPVLDGHDELSNLRKQLRHQQQAHQELQTMLKSGKSKWGLSNGGLRPLSAICTTIVHFCGLLGPFPRGTFVAKRRQS